MRKRSNWQKMLFQEVKECLPPEQNLAKWLGEILSIDTSNVYRRLRGEKALQLWELNIMARNLPELPIILERIWSIHNRTYSLLLELKNWQEIQQHLKLLCDLYQRSYQYGQPVLSFDRVVPFPLLLGNRQLMKMTFTMMRGEDLANDMLIPDPVKRQVSRYLSVYERTHSTELWYLRGMIGFLERISYFQSLGLASEEHLHQAKRELASATRQHFNYATEGFKRRGGRGELFISEFGLMDSLVISGETTVHCLGNPLDSILRHSEDPRACQLVFSKWQNQRSVCIQASKLTWRYAKIALEDILKAIHEY